MQIKFVRRSIAVASLLGAMAAAPALAADGKQLYEEKGCSACHGEDAATPLQEGYPRLAGQNPDYLFNQLKDIKSGARANGQTTDTMKPMVEEMEEGDMRALADFLATLPRPKTADAGHPAKKLYTTKTCIACHGKDGAKPILKTYPALAGQDKAYLIAQAKDIQSSTRTNGGSNAMQPVMHLVSDEDLAAIADFLANVK
ncbi:c-type cytochrome [Magnetospirillum aberrantis]|uniref:C-type cytochrome n=1 Tax=Magnetospirillum aberrantis SpK TaxID=908842 RepID=A0A7C9QRG9_9PROT|nr:c-type cytochrome [Magnetospirillum aberrantis]NFV78604.1 c-type cytochrome [Magnetospirillum aberrantis SpK]